MQKKFDSACRGGDYETVVSLIDHPEVDPSSKSNYGLQLAVSMGYHRCMASEATGDDRSCQEEFQGYVKIVKLLLKDPRVDPSDSDNNAICDAGYLGWTEMVRLLLQDPRVDPTVRHCYPIGWARYNNISSWYGWQEDTRYIKTMELLLQDERVVKALRKDLYKPGLYEHIIRPRDLRLLCLFIIGHQRNLPDIIINKIARYIPYELSRKEVGSY